MKTPGRVLTRMLRRFRPAPPSDPFSHLHANVLRVKNISCLRRAMNWTREPLLEGEHLHNFEYLEDLNERRLRDAEVIGSACCNGDPKIILEIGTASGQTTALMARNAPNAVIHTVNLPPEEAATGGTLITYAPSCEEIGRCYREKGFRNVRQILANTASWEPDFGPIDVVFIDGCHDADFVFNDTRKALTKCRSGSIILWHDFDPNIVMVYDWISEVCRGVERLYREALIRGRVLQLQDSWVGLYRVP